MPVCKQRDVMKLINQSKTARLDIGCGEAKQDGFIGMDKRNVKGVDILHDVETIPYPIKAETFSAILASHIVEHIKPWLFIDVMNELWRILKPKGRLMIATPYAGSFGYWQDPTHCNPCNEATWTYFDSRHPLYGIYKPKPWKIVSSVWNNNGNMEVIFEKDGVS